MRGLDLYEQEHVLDIEIEPQGKYENVIASVQGSGRKVYEVDISVDLETEEPDGFFCECPAFMSYDGICKHCVAALLEYLDEKTKSGDLDQIWLDKIQGVKKGMRRQASPELTALFQKQAFVRSLPLIQNETYGKVRLEPRFSCVGGTFEVKFKIGVSRMYVMKDVLSFAGFVENKEDHEYGKSLRFIHAKEAFEEQSRPLVDFVLRWAENYRQTHRRYSYYGYYTDGYEKMRSITLKGHEIEEYLLLYEGKKIYGDVPGTRRDTWIVTTEKLPRTLTITGEEDGIELKITKFMFGGNYDKYVFCRDYLPVLQDYFKIRKFHFAPETMRWIWVITFLLSDYREEERKEQQKGTLIVAPASLVYNWRSEFQKFAPELPVKMITGTAEERTRMVKEAGKRDILLTSYDLLKRDMEAYQYYQFRHQIIDEAQFIKNHTTQAAHAVKETPADFKLALTGTPVENRLSELWSIFDYLMPGFLYGYQRFHEELENPIVQNVDETAMKRLQKIISPFMLRRLKKMC